MDRVLLTLATLGFAALVCLAMLRGWRNRQRRQADLPAPPPVPEGGTLVVGAVPGVFVGTVVAGDWLDRVAVHRLSDRATGELVVRDDGVVIDREGVGPLFVGLDALRAAEPGDALAGKVVGTEGLLLLTWRLGGRTLQSAFRADDHAQHRRLADALTAAITARAAGRPAEHPENHPANRPPNEEDL